MVLSLKAALKKVLNFVLPSQTKVQPATRVEHWKTKEMTQTESLRLELLPYLEGDMKMRLHPKTRTFIKSELKTLASDLQMSKKNLRLHMQQRNYDVKEQYHVLRAKKQYRALHVAYSLLRGK